MIYNNSIYQLFRCFMKKTNSIPINMNTQNGAVLMVGLVVLLLLTMLGITAASQSGLEEKMAGNYWDKNLSFQAAESALLAAKKQVENHNYTSSDFACANGLYPEDGLDCDSPNVKAKNPAGVPIWKNIDWTKNAIQFGSGIHTSNQPYYIIEYMGPKCLNGELPPCSHTQFRATAYANGSTDTSVSILQEVFYI